MVKACHRQDARNKTLANACICNLEMLSDLNEKGLCKRATYPLMSKVFSRGHALLCGWYIVHFTGLIVDKVVVVLMSTTATD